MQNCTPHARKLKFYLALTIASIVFFSCGLKLPFSVSTLLVTCDKYWVSVFEALEESRNNEYLQHVSISKQNQMKLWLNATTTALQFLHLWYETYDDWFPKALKFSSTVRIWTRELPVHLQLSARHDIGHHFAQQLS